MAVTFDTVAPSSSGQSSAAASSISWSHTCSGTNNLLLVGVTCGTTGVTITVKWGLRTLSSVGLVNSNNQTSGFVQFFKLVGAGGGTSTVTVTASTASDLTGGSMSFNGADQSTGIGTVYTNFGNSTAISVPLTSTTTGNLCAGVACCGTTITSATSPATSEYIANLNFSSGAGNGAGAISNSTGSAVTMAWADSGGDWWGAIAAEVLAAAGGGSPANTAPIAWLV